MRIRGQGPLVSVRTRNYEAFLGSAWSSRVIGIGRDVRRVFTEDGTQTVNRSEQLGTKRGAFSLTHFPSASKDFALILTINNMFVQVELETGAILI